MKPTLEPDIFVDIQGVTKIFGKYKALDNVSLQVERATIHAILGENGAGKSTLMNILYGLYQPESGEIKIKGQRFNAGIPSPKVAIGMGIGMIHQHFMQVPSLSVTENIILGLNEEGQRLNLQQHHRRVTELAEKAQLPIAPHTLVGELSMGMRQRVEILKALYREAELLIFDEPTSVLAPDEIDAFLANLKILRQAGCTVIFITHKLKEVMKVADHTTIMRHGKMTFSSPCADTDIEELASQMVGKKVGQRGALHHTCIQDAPLLHLENVSTRKRDGSTTNLKNMSFTLYEGEIFGIAGVEGNGQNSLAELIAGLLPVKEGEIIFGDKIITRTDAHTRKRDGIRYVPGDRQSVGIVQDYACWRNISLRDFETAPFSNAFGILNFRYMKKYAEQVVKKYDVRLSSLSQKIRFLSGGNQQKLLLGREIEADPKLLIVVQPCKGLDIGAIDAVHDLLIQEKKKGTTVLYISSELDDVLYISDRIGILSSGKMIDILNHKEASAERIGMCMAGVAIKQGEPHETV